MKDTSFSTFPFDEERKQLEERRKEKAAEAMRREIARREADEQLEKKRKKDEHDEKVFKVWAIAFAVCATMGESFYLCRELKAFVGNESRPAVPWHLVIIIVTQTVACILAFIRWRFGHYMFSAPFRWLFWFLWPPVAIAVIYAFTTIPHRLLWSAIADGYSVATGAFMGSNLLALASLAFLTIVAALAVVVWIVSRKFARPAATASAPTLPPPLPQYQVQVAPKEKPTANGNGQEFLNPYVNVRWRLLQDNVVEISWQFSGLAWNCTLLGYRNETEFALEKISKTANGKLIVEARSDSATFEHLTPGREYFYTFLVTEWEKKRFYEPQELCRTDIRFKLTVPQSVSKVDTLKEYNAILDEEFRAKAKKAQLDRLGLPEPDKHKVRLALILGELRNETECRNALRDYQRQEEQRIRLLKLPMEEEADEIREVGEAIFQAKNIYLDERSRQ